jgi:guanylate kinase
LSETARNGNLIIVSGPSGAGKSALVGSVLRRIPHVRFSVSYTTRAPRATERDGVEYFFVSQPRFESLIRDESFLEWAEVHGNYYGTSGKFVDDLLRAGEDVLLDIDVQGAEIVRRKRADAVAVFILPPSYQVLRDRLLRRSLDDGPLNPVVVEKRLKIARREVSHYKEYDYLIVNEDLGNSIQELESIILGTRCRMAARVESAKSVLTTFGGMDAEDP